MKRLLLAFALLYSSATYAGEGDVYRCFTDNVTEVGKSGNEQIPKSLYKEFKFYWTETQIIFSGGHLDNWRMSITRNYPEKEMWYGSSGVFGMAFFVNGDLSTTGVNILNNNISVRRATCEKL